MTAASRARGNSRADSKQVQDRRFRQRTSQYQISTRKMAQPDPLQADGEPFCASAHRTRARCIGSERRYRWPRARFRALHEWLEGVENLVPPFEIPSKSL